MIDWTKATKAEVDVITEAIDAYMFRLERVEISHRNVAKRNDATWRLHVIEQLRYQIDNR